MADGVVKTRVDDLIDYLQGRDMVPIDEVAKALNVKSATIQSWIDFLVEEGMLGIEYKFTKPYVYINKPDKQKARVTRDEVLSWDAYHEAFLRKASEKQIPNIKAAALWKNHVLTLIEEKKQFFFDEARKRELADVGKLWEQYKTETLMRI